MTSPAIEFVLTLEEREAKATGHLDNAQREWMYFCKEVLAIQESGEWKSKADTWHQYVRDTWDYDSSRIRQYKASLPYAEKIIEVTEDIISVTEGDIRKLKKHISADDPDMVEAYKAGVQAARANGESVESRHFKHAVGVITQARETNGFVDVGEDNQVPIGFENSTVLATLQSLDEATKRRKQKFTDKKRRLKVTAKKFGGAYQLITETGEILPDTVEFVLWMDC